MQNQQRVSRGAEGPPPWPRHPAPGTDKHPELSRCGCARTGVDGGPRQLCACQAPAVSTPLLWARHSRLLAPGRPGLTAGLLGSQGRESPGCRAHRLRASRGARSFRPPPSTLSGPCWSSSPDKRCTPTGFYVRGRLQGFKAPPRKGIPGTPRGRAEGGHALGLLAFRRKAGALTMTRIRERVSCRPPGGGAAGALQGPSGRGKPRLGDGGSRGRGEGPPPTATAATLSAEHVHTPAPVPQTPGSPGPSFPARGRCGPSRTQWLMGAARRLALGPVESCPWPLPLSSCSHLSCF